MNICNGCGDDLPPGINYCDVWCEGTNSMAIILTVRPKSRVVRVRIPGRKRMAVSLPDVGDYILNLDLWAEGCD